MVAIKKKKKLNLSKCTSTPLKRTLHLIGEYNSLIVFIVTSVYKFYTIKFIVFSIFHSKRSLLLKLNHVLPTFPEVNFKIISSINKILC